jgi:threonine synthase
MSFVLGLRCRECGREYPKKPIAGCEECFAPLKVEYDYEAIGRVLTREIIEERPFSIWRYRELMPLDAPPSVGLATGGTPLLRANRLAKVLGLEELYLKNDSVNFPTLSFKDRVTAIAVNKAIEFGLDAVGCASTGNLANSVAANAAAAGLPAWILIPDDLEPAKVTATSVYGAHVLAVRGNYDDVNRLCSQIADRYGWGFVNVNLRPYYGDGSRSVGYEIAEQLGWRAPDAVVVPMAGGSLITKVYQGFREFEQLGLLEEEVRTRIFGAQATGCNPISAAVRKGGTEIRPVKPHTIAKSLAIGSPADGFYAAGVIRDSGGWADDVSDPEIVENIRLLAETEGIFTETAGGVALGVARKLIREGRIRPRDRTVIVVTGNGLKTQDALSLEAPTVIDAALGSFDAAVHALELTA